MQAILDALLQAVPLIAAAVVPLIIGFFKDNVLAKIPPTALPLILPILGGLFTSLAKLVGFDIGDVNPATADIGWWGTAVMGVIVGSASIGIHQLATKSLGWFQPSKE